MFSISYSSKLSHYNRSPIKSNKKHSSHYSEPEENNDTDQKSFEVEDETEKEPPNGEVRIWNSSF